MTRGTAETIETEHVHEWVSCKTPLDAPKQWYRCKGCGAYGFSREKRSDDVGKPFVKGKSITLYRCSLRDCGEPAIERLYGRGTRCSFIWRCAEHLKNGG